MLFTHEMHDLGSVSELTKHGISFIADNLIMLCFIERDRELKRYIRIIKMRNSNHSTILHELKIEKGKMSIGSSLGEKFLG